MTSNNPPADARFYLEQLKAIPLPDPETISEETATQFSDAIDQIRKIAKLAEADRKALKEPYLEKGRKIDSEFRPVKAFAEDALAPVRRALSEFLALQERRKREAAQRAAEDAAAKAALAEKLKADAFIADHAKEQAENAEREAKYAALLAEQNGVKGDHSEKAISLRTYRRAEITDAKALVNYYASNRDVVALCERLANAEIRAAKGEAIDIPGVQIVNEKRAV